MVTTSAVNSPRAASLSRMIRNVLELERFQDLILDAHDVNHPMFRLADRAIDELVRLALKQSEERVAHMVSVRFPSAVDLKFLSL